LIQQQVLLYPLTRQSHAHGRRILAQDAEGEVSESDQRDVSNGGTSERHGHGAYEC
jgi:hypothetical protein